MKIAVLDEIENKKHVKARFTVVTEKDFYSTMQICGRKVFFD